VLAAFGFERGSIAWIFEKQKQMLRILSCGAAPVIDNDTTYGQIWGCEERTFSFFDAAHFQ
jgi:predicted N-acyltransferase